MPRDTTVSLATLRAHARTYVRHALDGLLQMSDYDPVMMPWSERDHQAIMDEVRRIRDGFRRRPADAAAALAARSGR